MKTYKLQKYGNTYEIALLKGAYGNNGTLAIEMYLVENGELTEPWNMLTVNIGDSDFMANETMAFVDTNNNGKDIIQWLVKNKIAKKTPFIGQSGFCTYPLVSFNSQLLQEMEEM